MKRARVLEILDRHKADSVLLTTAAAVNWYLDGARTHVSLAAPPIVAVRVGRHGDVVHLTGNERDRMLREELPEDVEVRARDWWLPAPADGIAEAAIAAELRAARSALLPTESARFAALGRRAAEALTDALEGATPDMTEAALAARVTGLVASRGMDSLVVLVGGESRSEHRHPLPTPSPIGRRAMVVLCARRWGLIANLTRWIRFGPATAEEEDSEARILEVEADAFAVTRAGAAVSDALAEIAAAYPRHGFPPVEWTRHHQGGPAGYDGRDPRAVPGLPDVFAPRAHVTWNPSAAGAKVEDTVVIEGGIVTPLTVDPRWPTTPVRGVARPSVLQLG
ncbi:M24 family metallopeptidase [Naasia sp. SYSU D00948]|uniref:M24 family metallopeptidase n=1 Tax=Naasia sp. SYSU D00948 TaxID=2817379 RepID=UPI0027DD162C|nr:M24 family metallopeptidase [Naasia sp. SYSU D00948]